MAEMEALEVAMTLGDLGDLGFEVTGLNNLLLTGPYSAWPPLGSAATAPTESVHALRTGRSLWRADGLIINNVQDWIAGVGRQATCFDHEMWLA